MRSSFYFFIIFMLKAINDELDLIVYEDWTVYTKDSERVHSSWNWTCKRKWRKLSFSDNWLWYQIANLSLRRKWIKKSKSVSQHRIVYATFNWLEYNWPYSVWHHNDTWNDNRLQNLYWIYGQKQNLQNLQHKKNAYKVYDRYQKWQLARNFIYWFISRFIDFIKKV